MNDSKNAESADVRFSFRFILVHMIFSFVAGFAGVISTLLVFFSTASILTLVIGGITSFLFCAVLFHSGGFAGFSHLMALTFTIVKRDEIVKETIQDSQMNIWPTIITISACLVGLVVFCSHYTINLFSFGCLLVGAASFAGYVYGLCAALVLLFAAKQQADKETLDP